MIRLQKTASSFTAQLIGEYFRTSAGQIGHGDLEYAREWVGRGIPINVTQRYPPDWLQSHWQDRMKQPGWGGDLTIAHDCASDNLNTFAMNVVRKHPSYINCLYERYLGRENDPQPPTVLRFEQLSEDLSRLVQRFGRRRDRKFGDRWLPLRDWKEVTPEFLAAKEPTNVGQFQSQAVYTPLVYSAVCDVTYKSIERFGYCNYEQDHPRRFARLLGMA